MTLLTFLLVFGLGFLLGIMLGSSKEDVPVTQKRKDLIAAIERAQNKGSAEIIWPNRAKEAFDNKSVKSINDIL